MMKRQTIKFVSAALLGVAVFASCQDYTPDEQAIIKRKTVADYEKAFNAEFPNIDPEQNWGFDPMPICGEDVDITRTMNTNSNEWVSVYHYEVPGGLSENGNAPWGWVAGDISNYERAYVYWWFSTHQWPEPLILKWNDLFIQQVWGQPEHSGITGDYENPSYTGAIRNGTDLLTILNIDRPAVNPPYNVEPPYNPTINDVASALTHGINNEPNGYEPVSDFNSGGDMQEAVMYALDVSTEDFYYRDSYGTSKNYHNNWTVRYINGNYYLGFDYWTVKDANNQYGTIYPDGYYNDWIIKLSNGTHLVSSYTRRIMCEDLGDTFDWDFNDLVFDVTIYKGEYGNGQSGYYAQIMLQAAGGTLPIYIGEKKPEYEAHFLFGVPTTTPVNVDAVGGVKRPAVEFNLPIPQAWVVESTNQYGKVYSIDFEKIPIIVDRSGSGMSNKESALVLTAEKGKAPQKFACPSDTYWMKEFQNIEGIENKQTAGHPNFAKWVAGDETITGEFVEGNQAASAFVTERSASSDKHFDVLYADPNGMPYSVSWWSSGDNPDAIRDWKYLWDNKPNDEQFTAVRSVPNFLKDGLADIDNDLYTTYSTTFEAQAPYIYKTQEDDDPTAYSPHMIAQIINEHFANQEREWGPYAKTVTLITSNGRDGYVLGSGYYTGGSNVLIQAVPRKYKRFVRWVEVDDNNNETFLSPDANYTIVNIQANKKYKAYFEDNTVKKHIYFNPIPKNAGYSQYHQEAFSDDNYTDGKGYDLGEFDPGEHDIIAVGYGDYIFDHCNPELTVDENMITVELDREDVIINAYFKIARIYTLTLQSNNDDYGTVSGGGVYKEGSTITITANPKPGYKFIKWTNPTGGPLNGEVNTPFDIHPERTFGNTTEITLIANFESFTSYYPTVLTPTLNGPFNDGYSLLQAVPALSNYSQCCLEVTYTGNPSFGYNDWNQVQLPWAGQSTTDYVEVLTNQLKINSGGGNISKIVVRVKP